MAPSDSSTHCHRPTTPSAEAPLHGLGPHRRHPAVALGQPLTRQRLRAALLALGCAGGLVGCGALTGGPPSTAPILQNAQGVQSAAPPAALRPAPSAATGPTTSAPPSAAQHVEIRLLAFNDFHGHLEPPPLPLQLADPDQPGALRSVPAGGAAYLAAALNRQRAERPHSITISSGDLIGASPWASALFSDEPTIEIMNALGLDLSVVGNHEFDQGVTELKRLAEGGCPVVPSPTAARTACDGRPHAGARFTYLAANVIDARQGTPLFPPYVIKQVDGERIAFVGVVTRTTPGIVKPSGVAGVRFLDELETLNRYANELDQQGIKALVAVVHEGGEVQGDWNDPRCPGATGEIFRITDALSPHFDVVLSAHTHQGYSCVRPNGVPVMQATAYGRGLSQVDLRIDRQTHEVLREQTQVRNLPVVNDLPTDERTRALYPPLVADPQIHNQVAAAAERAAPRARKVVGQLTGPISRQPDDGGDSPAGRLIADAQLGATRSPERGGAQIAFMNSGGIRADFACAVPPCDLLYGQAFSVQPFGNSLVVMSLSGAQIKALLEQQALGPNAQRARMLQPSAGFSYRWHPEAPAGERASDLRLHQHPLIPDQRYRVTVNSFLADGGDGFTVLKAGTERLGGAQDLDALIEHFRLRGPLHADPRGRIQRAAPGAP